MEKDLGVFLKQEKCHMRVHEPGKVYFLKEEENQCLEDKIESKANNVMWVQNHRA